MSDALAYSATLAFGLPAACYGIHMHYIHSAWRQRLIVLRDVLLYMGACLLIAPLCEVLFDRLYMAYFGHQLWRYEIAPIAGGDTSWFGLLIWSMYGLNLYIVYQQMDKLKSRFWRSDLGKGLVMGLEAPVFEIVFNLLFLMMFGKYVAYYLPGDLGHLTSVQVVPIYAWCGFWGAFWLRKLVKYNSWTMVAAIWAFAALSLTLISKL